MSDCVSDPFDWTWERKMQSSKSVPAQTSNKLWFFLQLLDVQHSKPTPTHFSVHDNSLIILGSLIPRTNYTFYRVRPVTFNLAPLSLGQPGTEAGGCAHRQRKYLLYRGFTGRTDCSYSPWLDPVF